MEGVKAAAREAHRQGATAVEVRLDHLEPAALAALGGSDRELAALLGACQGGGAAAVVATCRAGWEGGEWRGDEQERLQLLHRCAREGADLVDVELKAAADWHRLVGDGGVAARGCKLILSSHDFEKTPPQAELEATIRRAWENGADVPKLAAMAQDSTEALRVLALHSLECNRGRPVVALSMGEAGLISRLLAGRCGGYLTFGTLGAGKESAPGQPTVADLLGLYRVPAQRPGSRVWGVMGKPVAQSMSPAIHNAALQRRGVDGVYVPLLVEDLPAFLDAAEPLDLFSGFSVTIPHKEAALRAAGEVDPVAGSIGAVNTLVRRADGAYFGTNTDWLAAISAVEEGLGGAGSLEGKVAVVIGAGGAGKALAFGAKAKGARVVVANRNLGRAQQLAAEVGGEAVPLEALQGSGVPGDVLLNTTSVGMHGGAVGESPASREALAASKYRLVFDAVYNPLETRLLRDAREQGALTVSGVEMFIGQAAEQFRLFTGEEPPVELMRQVVMDKLQG